MLKSFAKTEFIIFKVFIILSIFTGCSTSFPIIQDKSDFKNKLFSANNNKNPQLICFSKITSVHGEYKKINSCGIYKVKEFKEYQRNNNNSSNQNAQTTDTYYALELQDLKDSKNKNIFVNLSDIIMTGSINNNDKIKLKYIPMNDERQLCYEFDCFLKDINLNIIEIVTDTKYEIDMIDGSKITGEISGINISNGDLIVKTQVKSFTLQPKIISSIKAFNISINLILIDGTQLKGILVSENNEEVRIKNILGEEVYPRNKIRKIIYLK